MSQSRFIRIINNRAMNKSQSRSSSNHAASRSDPPLSRSVPLAHAFWFCVLIRAMLFAGCTSSRTCWPIRSPSFQGSTWIRAHQFDNRTEKRDGSCAFLVRGRNQKKV